MRPASRRVSEARLMGQVESLSCHLKFALRTGRFRSLTYYQGCSETTGHLDPHIRSIGAALPNTHRKTSSEYPHNVNPGVPGKFEGLGPWIKSVAFPSSLWGLVNVWRHSFRRRRRAKIASFDGFLSYAAFLAGAQVAGRFGLGIPSLCVSSAAGSNTLG